MVKSNQLNYIMKKGSHKIAKPTAPKGKISRDIFSKRKRSEIMSAVKSKNTLLERRVFSLLRKSGLRFKIHYAKVIGKPDIAIPSKKRAIFIDSDFWHGWRYPKWKHRLTSDFWVNKIEANRKRDRKVNRILRRDGWQILRIWEHNLEKDMARTVLRVEKYLRD